MVQVGALFDRGELRVRVEGTRTRGVDQDDDDHAEDPHHPADQSQDPFPGLKMLRSELLLREPF